MKLKLIMGAILALSMSLCACSSASDEPAPEMVSIDDSFAGSEVEVAAGGSLVITLETNPKIGLEWALKNISDQTVLKLVNQTFKPPESGAASGSNGQEIWSFKTLGKGMSTIFMEYRQPWQKQFPPENTFDLTVIVK